MGIPELWEFPDLIVFKTLENPFPKSSVWECHTLRYTSLTRQCFVSLVGIVGIVGIVRI